MNVGGTLLTLDAHAICHRTHSVVQIILFFIASEAWHFKSAFLGYPAQLAGLVS